ncbi:MAG: NAD(P)H-quinone oxidoreductase [Nocardiopsaceae bacterium]|jgi:putative PIG3 family NAD(P)H quinone oxidoreductase|nr:NAD(P)H-quinone oxidoreductase [Nocardiopsaceae bacterium]
MRAVIIPSPGGPEVLRLAEVPDPVPGPGEVLVEIAAAGVNRADLLQRQGAYPPPPGAPEYPGLECAGRITALGPGVTGWQAGDQVCALLAGGGYAEQVAVPAGQLLPLPAGLEPTEAAALPEAACTVHSNVFARAGLAAGETLLVHGGASGIGTLAIQLARALGARVACTAGSPAKLARCRELGAGLAISYRDEDFAAAVAEFTGGHGADVILDIIGGPYLPRNVATLATGGRLVVIAVQSGGKGELDLGLLMAKRASVLASTLRGRPLAEKAAIVDAVRAQVWPLVSDGQVRPVIHRVLPMAEAAAAHQILTEGSHVGKVVLVN